MEQDQQSRTEAPTFRRREEARKRGEVALSRDLVAGFGLLAAVSVLLMFGSEMGEHLMATIRNGISDANVEELKSAHVVAMFRSGGQQILLAIGGLVAAVMATHSFLAVIQSGWHISWKPLQPDWNRLNPASGFGRLFSSTAVMRGVQAILKTVVLAVIMSMAMKSLSARVAMAPLGSLVAAVGTGWEMALRASASVALAMVILGVTDYAFQRWKFEQKLRMTLQEVKDERKEDEGDPQVRARIKRVQRDMSRQRMLQDVVTASVVLTNPTHYAIALKYDGDSMTAPKVVAKGVDHVALSIRKIAAENNVPVLERKSLARTLYKTVEVGQEIPHALYHAIAEIVAYLHRVGRFR